MPLEEFKGKARPLHLSVTHTPPSIDTKDTTVSNGATGDDATAPIDPIAEANKPETTPDAGLISSLTLLPKSFKTGSYGWTGSRKIIVELQGSEEGEEGREKVQVMLT